jgi:hypothetical protein
VGRDNTPDAKHTSFEPLTYAQTLRVVDSLPHSLKELALRACFPPTYQVIEVLLERKRQGGLKSLKKIDPLFQKDFPEQKFQDDSEGLKYELLGVKIGVQITRSRVEFFH